MLVDERPHKAGDNPSKEDNMTEATANAGLPASDSAQPSITLDDAANIDFSDPGVDNEEVEEEQQSETETDEAEGQESDETPSEEDDTAEAEDEGAEDAAKPEPEDDVTVTVNGQKLSLSTLKAGYMKERDYRHKTQELGNKRRDLEALSARVNQSVEAIAEFLTKQIPEAPDPQLAMTNPGEYVQKKALHEAAMVQVNAILSKAGDVKDVANTLTTEQRKELIDSENAKLAEAFPVTATQEGRKKFFEKAASAAKELGYSEEEINSTTDHRMFALAHYASIGFAAEQAKAKAAKKVANAPPVAQQRRQQGANASKARANQEAMKRLSKSGSIHDALSIDFD